MNENVIRMGSNARSVSTFKMVQNSQASVTLSACWFSPFFLRKAQIMFTCELTKIW